MNSHKVLFIASQEPVGKRNALVFKVPTRSEEEIAREIEEHLVEWGRKGYEYMDLKPHMLPNASGYAKPMGYFLLLKKTL